MPHDSSLGEADRECRCAGPELIVVLPVFNEEASLRHVFNPWFDVIERHVDDFVFLVVDDGSSDRTPEILAELAVARHPRVDVVSQVNAGHGRACVRGYEAACARRTGFVLQIDSDGQCDPADFPPFWAARHQFDVIMGVRRWRRDGWRRVFASTILRLLILVKSRVWCKDANVPFRLMRASILHQHLKQIPRDFCLANVALSVVLKRDISVHHGFRMINFFERFGGEPSVPFNRFAEKAFQLYRQLGQLRD